VYGFIWKRSVNITQQRFLLTEQAVYYERNNEARSCNHCCSGKAIGSTYSECVFVVLVTQHAKLMRSVVICGLSGCTLFFPRLINGTISGKKKLLYIKCFFFIFSTTFVREISDSKN